ncbi:MAG TPA: DHH family phosphoesterase [Patescibacteria group bacterium]|nr:DHH family phosphoesterase [Patescibacteria group bacterium]
MTLEPKEQFINFLDKSQDILILIPENPSADAVGSSWALYYFLEKKEKNPTIAFSNHLNEKYGFLTKPSRILNEISGARDFVLSFDVSRNKIKNFHHEKKDDKFNIYITPEHGTIDPRDFSFILAKFKYDLIIVIDCPDLEKLGKLYNSNTDLFFEVPVINIDWRSGNDNFGQINLVDVTSSSCSEIIGRAIEEIDILSMDKQIATAVLAGIIGATDSFQKKNTTPKSFLFAAHLMDKGADQQEIIRWLYKTQPLHILKLWGRTMAKLQWDANVKTVSAAITIDDFVQSRSNIKDVPLILEKLQENYTEGLIFFAAFSDTPSSSVILIKSANYETFKKLYINFGGEIKQGLLELKTEKTDLEEVRRGIVEKIKGI